MSLLFNQSAQSLFKHWRYSIGGLVRRKENLNMNWFCAQKQVDGESKPSPGRCDPSPSRDQPQIWSLWRHIGHTQMLFKVYGVFLPEKPFFQAAFLLQFPHGNLHMSRAPTELQCVLEQKPQLLTKSLPKSFSFTKVLSHSQHRANTSSIPLFPLNLCWFKRKLFLSHSSMRGKAES